MQYKACCNPSHINTLVDKQSQVSQAQNIDYATSTQASTSLLVSSHRAALWPGLAINRFEFAKSRALTGPGGVRCWFALAANLVAASTLQWFLWPKLVLRHLRNCPRVKLEIIDFWPENPIG